MFTYTAETETCHTETKPTFTNNILKVSTPCILAVSHFLLFPLNAHNMFNTYIYHILCI